MKNETNVAFAANLKRLMRASSINDVTLARAAGLSHTAIANYKQGRLPKLDALHKLAAHFEVPIDELLRGADAGLALRIAATVAGNNAGARIEEQQGRFEAVANELLSWQERARVAEEKLGQVQAALTALVARLEAHGARPKPRASGRSKRH